VARGVSQRSTVQILSGVLIRAEAGGAVELAATDMELSVRASLQADVAEPGSTVLTGRLLLEIVRALPQQPVTLEQAAGSGAVKLTCGPSEYTLHSQGAEDFRTSPRRRGQRSPSIVPRSSRRSTTSPGRRRRTSPVRC
jgi:DNA polymerase-3 subunit beta